MSSSSSSDSECGEMRRPPVRKRKKVSQLFLFSSQNAVKEQNKILQESGQLRKATKILHHKVVESSAKPNFVTDNQLCAITELGNKEDQHPLKYFNDKLFDEFCKEKETEPPKKPKYIPEMSTSVSYKPTHSGLQLVESVGRQPHVTDDFEFDDKDGVLEKYLSSADEPTTSEHQCRRKMIKLERHLHNLIRIIMDEEEHREKEKQLKTQTSVNNKS